MTAATARGASLSPESEVASQVPAIEIEPDDLADITELTRQLEGRVR